jgi:phage-related minor tail protein
VQELAQVQLEIKKEKEQPTKKKYLATKEFMATLANQIDEKKKNNEHKEFLAAELDAQNSRFNAMKNSYCQKRKDFYDKKTEYYIIDNSDRTKMTAHISPLNVQSTNDKDKARSNFLIALANAPFKRPVHNPACTFKVEFEEYREARVNFT